MPQADLTPVSGTLYELDIDTFRLALKSIEDSEEGMAQLDTHRHNTEVVLSGVTYARTFEIINGYTVTFEDTGSPYTVRCAGANHNLADVTNFTSEVSLIVGNSAGLITADDATGLADAVWAKIIETGFDASRMLRIIAAAAAGKSSGGPGSPVFRNLADSQDQITGTATENGDRTAATYGA